jgi:hypothetical protein
MAIKEKKNLTTRLNRATQGLKKVTDEITAKILANSDDAFTLFYMSKGDI